MWCAECWCSWHIEVIRKLIKVEYFRAVKVKENWVFTRATRKVEDEVSERERKVRKGEEEEGREEKQRRSAVKQAVVIVRWLPASRPTPSTACPHNTSSATTKSSSMWSSRTQRCVPSRNMPGIKWVARLLRALLDVTFEYWQIVPLRGWLIRLRNRIKSKIIFSFSIRDVKEKKLNANGIRSQRAAPSWDWKSLNRRPGLIVWCLCVCACLNRNCAMLDVSMVV